MLQIQIQKMERFISVCLEKRITEFVVIHGVGEGKAKRYGTDFVALINSYVNENEMRYVAILFC